MWLTISAENYTSYVKLPTRVDNMALYEYVCAIGKTHYGLLYY